MIYTPIHCEKKKMKKKTVEKGEEEMPRRRIFTAATIIAIVLVLVVISIELLSVPVATAYIVERNFTKEGGWIFYKGALPDDYEDEANKVMVFEGERIFFMNRTTHVSKDVIVSGTYTKAGSPRSGHREFPPVVAGTPWVSTEDGHFLKVVEAEADNPEIGGWFAADDHSFRLELEKEKVREDENLTLRIERNNKKAGVMKLSIEDEEGFLIKTRNGTFLNEILIWYENETEFSGFYDRDDAISGISFDDDGALVFDARQLNMREGEYKIILADYATGEDSDEKIEVTGIFLDVEFEKEVVRGDEIVITITSSFFEEDVNVTVGNFYKRILLPLDGEGKIRLTVPTEAEDVRYGTHKIEVEISGTQEREIGYITINRGEARLEEIPDTATTGDIVQIRGTSTFGDFVVFVINDRFRAEVRIKDDEFEWYWNTRGELEGYRAIEVFILSEHASFYPGASVSEDWQNENGVDASMGIFMLLPDFNMTAPEKNIAEGDDAILRGKATGTDHIFLIVINHRGDVVFPAGGIAIATHVDDRGDWEEIISGLNTGRYTVISVHKGRDGRSDALDAGKWAVGGEGKTLDQRMGILKDALTPAGGDDIFEIAHFTVTRPDLSLEIPEIVKIGDTISVRAVTNIRDGERAFMRLIFNESAVTRISALVKNGSADGKFNTSELLPGIYIIAVEIGGRASAEKEVRLELEKVEKEKEQERPQQNVSATVSEEEVNGEEAAENEREEAAKEREIPVRVWDLLTGVVVASLILVALKRRRRSC